MTMTLARLSFLLVPLLIGGCGEQSTGDAGDADTDVDTDADTDADTDSDADGDGVLRIEFLDLVAPDALDNALVENLINENIADYTLNWLIELGPPNGGTCTYRSGAALVDEDSCAECDTAGVCDDCTAFIFETEYPPGEGNADCSDADFRVPEGTGVIETVDIPVRGDPFIVLPLREASLGGAYGSGPDATGTINSKITLADAVAVEIEDLGMTLCGLLGGDNGDLGNFDDDCLNILACDAGKTPPEATWNCDSSGNPPDTDVDGEPAWALTGDYEADWVDLGM
jgi:hypothetical protein